MLRTALKRIFRAYPKFGWRFRHLVDPGWAENYSSKEALDHPHRDAILASLTALRPFSSVLELGCGGGANLLSVAKQWPWTMLLGMDISKAATTEACNLLRGRGLRWMILRGDATNLELLQGLSFDVILTDAFLIYVTPKKLKPLLEAMKERCTVGMVLCEKHTFEKSFKDGDWIHNYSEYLSDAAYLKLTRADWDDDQWSKSGTVIVWRKPKTAPNSGA